MKQIVNVGIGGRSFVLENGAYNKLDLYLKRFRSSAAMGYQTNEVMDDLEGRIAELFMEGLSASSKDVVDLEMVNGVIAQLGMPDGEPFREEPGCGGDGGPWPQMGRAAKKLYRKMEGKGIGGVCGGLALYLDIDILLVRLLFIIGFLFGSATFWVYVVIWIVAPAANTPLQKCEMYGVPPTAENLNKFNN